MKQEGWRLEVKKMFDRTAAATLLVATAPVLGAAMVAVRATLGSPVFFRQSRPGKNGRPFRIWKLRTMKDTRGRDGALLSDAERLTPLGHVLRSSSVDELPQLLNVLAGDMSLVGPRPLLMDYLPLYSAEQARRHDVLPGITGWAQVNGRNTLTWESKFAHDVWYAAHWSLWLDAKILAKTMLAVVRRGGIAGAGSATMHAFTGSGPERASGDGDAR